MTNVLRGSRRVRTVPDVRSVSDFPPSTTADQRMDGKAIFRFDTFGDEQLWTDVLRMHEAIDDCRSEDGTLRRTQGRRRGAASGNHRRVKGGQTWT